MCEFTFQNKHRNKKRNLTFTFQIAISFLNIQERKLMIYQLPRILKTAHNTNRNY
jgi:hypothetical protein